jgi:glutathione S-transferase
MVRRDGLRVRCFTRDGHDWADISLADIHLAPMIGYFAMAEEGDALLKMQCKLSNWWSTMSARTAYRATKPRLPT